MKNRYLKKTLLTLGLAVTAGVLTFGINAALGSAPVEQPPGTDYVSPTFSALTVQDKVGNGVIALGGVRNADRAELHLHANDDNVSEIMFGINEREDENVKWAISSRPGGTTDWQRDALHILEGPYNTEGSFSQNMTFLPGGNVGIGTTNPSSRFNVSGGILRHTGSGGVLDFWHGGSYGVIGTNTSTRLSLRTGNQNRMTILPDGKIGIGTTEPIAELHVSGSTGIEEDLVVVENIAAGENIIALGNIWTGGSFRLASGGGTEGLHGTCSPDNRGEVKFEEFNIDGTDVDFLFACVKVGNDYYWGRLEMELVTLTLEHHMP